MFRKQDTRQLAFWNLVPEHEMAVAPHRWGPNEKLMVPFNRGTDALWGYLAVGPRLLALVLLFQLKLRGALKRTGADRGIEPPRKPELIRPRFHSNDQIRVGINERSA